jgi:hypothetical protein
MCDRVTRRSSPIAIAQEFDLFEVPDLSASFNVAPGQAVPVMRQEPDAKHLPGLLPLGSGQLFARASGRVKEDGFRKIGGSTGLPDQRGCR